MNILIIDDDSEDAMLLHEVILAVAPKVTCNISLSYNEARESLQESGIPDFIFLDAFMYPVGGKETLAMLTQMDKLSDTTIIINSGGLSPTQIKEFNALGADRILQKPSSYSSWISSVKEILALER